MVKICGSRTSHILLPREFLTGFHKRKVAKKEEAKKRAQLKEKQERLETRREVCLSLPVYLHKV
jgi:hypothetical protein